jgi:serine/threonine protein kinase
MNNDYKYVLDDIIGRGTFNQTQKAEIAGLDRAVIVKTLASHLRQNAEYPHFKQQVQTLASRLIQHPHPHLPPVIDLFEEDEFPFIIYEAIAGETLAQHLEAAGALARAQALDYIQQIADAIAHLHRADLLHLDIQPQHIIRRQDSETVVLIEFGLTSQLNQAIKQTHANLLAPGYAAPEQHDPKANCTPATDIYALSATLYALLTGNPPPPAPTRLCIADAEWQQWPESLSESIKTAIRQGLDLNPQNRPQTVAAWLSVLTQPQTAPIAVETPKADARVVAPQPEVAPKSVVPHLEVAPITEIQQLTQLQSPTESAPKKPTPSRQVTSKTEEIKKASPKISKSPQNKAKGAQTFPKPPAARASRLDDFPVTNLKKTKRQARGKFPFGALVTTCLVAASAGAGFGLSVRFNRPDEAGSTLWHLKQSFPPRAVEDEDW